MLWHPAYVGIGSNLEDPVRQVRRALRALGSLPHTRLQCQSSLYGSEPMGPEPQPRYVNAVAALLTQTEPASLLTQLRAIERQLGKQLTHVRWGPRIIDLDLLVFAQVRMQSQELTLPHPGIVQRNFVLYPLQEVAAELDVPGCGRVSRLAARVDPTGIWRLMDDTTTHDA